MSHRKFLPARRDCVTQKAVIGNTTVYLNWGVYEDGSLGEIFLDVGKDGTALRFWMSNTAMLFSLALQNQTPLETLVTMFHGTKSEPFGPVSGHPRITQCTSIPDYVVRSLAIDFLHRDDLADCPDIATVDNPAGYISTGSGV